MSLELVLKQGLHIIYNKGDESNSLLALQSMILDPHSEFSKINFLKYITPHLVINEDNVFQVEINDLDFIDFDSYTINKFKICNDLYNITYEVCDKTGSIIYDTRTLKDYDEEEIDEKESDEEEGGEKEDNHKINPSEIFYLILFVGSITAAQILSVYYFGFSLFINK